MKEKKNNRKFARNMAVVLLLCLFVMALGRVLKSDDKFSNDENRILSQKPQFTVDRLLCGTYASDFEKYMNDQFPLRSQFMSIKTNIDILMGKKESQGVVRGKNGYLMEKFSPYDNATEQKKRSALEKFIKKNNKVNMSFLIAPTAINVMKDRVPKGIPMKDQNDAMDNLFQWVEAQGAHAIDARDALSQHTGEPIFYKTDHHWTTYGAYVSFCDAAAPVLQLDPNQVKYQANCVTTKFQGSLIFKSGYEHGYKEPIEVYLPTSGGVHSIVNYVQEQKKTATLYNHKKLAGRQAYEVFLDGNHSLVRIASPVDNQKVLMILKDSYANCFIPFLTAYYSEIVVVDPRYFYDDLQNLMEAESVTDVLFLYNANTYFSDTSLTSVLE